MGVSRKTLSVPTILLKLKRLISASNFYCKQKSPKGVNLKGHKMSTFVEAVANQEARTANGMKARKSTAKATVDLSLIHI